MSRRPRIQFPGAIYHVFSRGNYRQNIFEDEGAANAFEQCLFEACDIAAWRLHAFVVMRNHFHLALETPRGNLAKGMHWLQSTFSKRFNNFRREHGHLFQSRYRALLVQPGFALACVVNYIHLNPARAHILPADQLMQFRHSSYRLFAIGQQPPFLICIDWLRALGFDDTKPGWASYRDYLVWLAADQTEQKRQSFEKLISGWAIGTKNWQDEILRTNQDRPNSDRIESSTERDLQEALWSRMLTDLLSAAGRNRDEVRTHKKGAPWKIGVAAELRRRTSATNAWIARELCMGSPQSLSVYLSKAGRQFKN